MLKSTRIKVIFSFLFVGLIAVLAVIYQNTFKKDIPEEVLGEKSVSGVPYIVSLAPVVGDEGVLYEYLVKVVDVDTDLKSITLEYVEGPSWLELDGFVLKGTPVVGSEGSYKVVLKVSDGENSSNQESYILVEGGNE